LRIPLRLYALAAGLLCVLSKSLTVKFCAETKDSASDSSSWYVRD
jgi:hypothetical protein